MSRAIEAAAEEADARVKRDLQHEGVEDAQTVEPRWMDILVVELTTGSEPHQPVNVQMTATLGGQAVLETTDSAGAPVFVGCWRKFECEIVDETDFVSREFATSQGVTVFVDNFDESVEWRKNQVDMETQPQVRNRTR